MVFTPFSFEFLEEGIYLFLGASDTGKTTLISAIASRLAASKKIAIVDADTGQSHIGPPGTVGWAIARKDENDLSKLPVEGISFVGNTSPVGHLLQETGAIIECLRKAIAMANTILIDTPGFVSGPAACVFWWEITRIIKPRIVFAIQRQSEMVDLIQGLKNSTSIITMINYSEAVKTKTPEQRRAHRQKKFAEYFTDARTYKISLKDIAIQSNGNSSNQTSTGLLIGLRDKSGNDIAMGYTVQYQGDMIIFKSPQIELTNIRCMVVGNSTVDLAL